MASGSEPELELAFLLAGTCERRRAAAGRITALAERADFDAFALELSRRRMLPLLGGRLVDALSGAAPAAFAERVEAALTAARAAAMALDARAVALVRLLDERGIRALRLKGPTLAEAAHGDVGLRSAGDIDLLVGRDDLQPALDAVVGATGYEPPLEGPPADRLPPLHFTLRHLERPPLELHWRVHWYEEAFSRDLLERARPGRDGLLEPTREDMAAALLLFYARDGFYGLRLAADIAGWTNRQLADNTAALLDGHARAYPELAPSLHAAALVANEVAGVPATTWLWDPRPVERRVRVAVRLANWAQTGSSGQPAANIGLVDALLSPPGARAEFIRRELGTAPDDRRVLHLTKRAARQLAALWTVRRAPWAPTPLPRNGESRRGDSNPRPLHYE